MVYRTHRQSPGPLHTQPQTPRYAGSDPREDRLCQSHCLLRGPRLASTHCWGRGEDWIFQEPFLVQRQLKRELPLHDRPRQSRHSARAPSRVCWELVWAHVCDNGKHRGTAGDPTGFPCEEQGQHSPRGWWRWWASTALPPRPSENTFSEPQSLYPRSGHTDTSSHRH